MATLAFTDQLILQISVEIKNGQNFGGLYGPIFNTHVQLFQGIVPDLTEMNAWVTGNERSADLLVDWTVAQLTTGVPPNATMADIIGGIAPGGIMRMLPNTPAERDALGLQVGIATWLWWHGGKDNLVGTGGFAWDVVFTVSGPSGAGEIKVNDPNIVIGQTYQLGPIELTQPQSYTI